jgi:hypothetical protein
VRPDAGAGSESPASANPPVPAVAGRAAAGTAARSMKPRLTSTLSARKRAARPVMSRWRLLARSSKKPE